MHCFNHPDIDALGVCKHCSKAICRECITDLGFGIACKNLHEENVKDVQFLVSRNIAITKKSSKGFIKYVCVFLYAACGLIFLVQGANDWRGNIFPVSLGAVFIVLAIASLKMARAVDDTTDKKPKE